MAALSVVGHPLLDLKHRAGEEGVQRHELNLLAGSSPAIGQLLEQLGRVAPHFRTALLSGERDCGEEQAARLLHQLSPLRDKPFLYLTTTVAEARFGQCGPPGAAASEGMLYLPYPEQIPKPVQKNLVRLLRERGPHAPRLVAFSERGLRSLVSMGAFSAELADSLGALRIVMPPLRARQEDIPALLTDMVRDQAESLGATVPQLSADLLEAASRHTWPGNFTQLRAVALGLMHRAGSAPLCAADLQTVLGTLPVPARRDRREIRMVSLEHIMHEHIRAVLSGCNGNNLRAAEVLGISRSTLYRMLESEIPRATAEAPLQDSRDGVVARQEFPVAS